MGSPHRIETAEVGSDARRCRSRLNPGAAIDAGHLGFNYPPSARCGNLRTLWYLRGDRPTVDDDAPTRPTMPPRIRAVARRAVPIRFVDSGSVLWTRPDWSVVVVTTGAVDHRELFRRGEDPLSDLISWNYVYCCQPSDVFPEVLRVSHRIQTDQPQRPEPRYARPLKRRRARRHRKVADASFPRNSVASSSKRGWPTSAE